MGAPPSGGRQLREYHSQLVRTDTPERVVLASLNLFYCENDPILTTSFVFDNVFVKRLKGVVRREIFRLS